MCERSFRRYLSRYEADGLEGLLDRRLEHVSYRKAPVDEGVALTGRERKWARRWPGQKWDLIVTMEDATGELYSMFFVEEEGTVSSFRGVQDVIEARGLFSSFYSDRGSHYWHTPEADGTVDR